MLGNNENPNGTKYNESFANKRLKKKKALNLF